LSVDFVREIESLARRVALEEIERRLAQFVPSAETTGEADRLREQLRLIEAKTFINVPEAAVLLNVSQSHIRNQVAKARRKKVSAPIPALDLGGVTTFHHESLLKWMAQQKGRRK
jgi:predicted DNA-binding protein (UPF0251 family)